MEKKKSICINFNKTFLAVVLFFVFVSTIFSINISASDNINIRLTSEEKKYFNGTIDDEFSNDKIIIVLSKEETNKYKEYTVSDFPEIDCKSVSDLTSSVVEMVKNNKVGGTNKSLINLDKFNRILSLELEEQSKENVIKSIKKLEQREEILSAEPNVPTQSCDTPSDSRISEQWGLNSVKAPDAWNICQNASQVIVGVLDSGIDSKHNDLTNRIYKSKPINDQLHRDFTSGLELGEPVLTPMDPDGHGTHVAGIIGAAGNISGICWDVKLVSLRVLDSNGNGNAAWLVNAINYAASVNIPILNCSLKANEESPALKSAIESYGGLLVCSAGNAGNDIDKKREYPASYDCDNIITVGAIDSNDNRSKWNDSSNLWGLAGEKSSNYGQTSVDIYAPGTDIYSTIPNNDYKKRMVHLWQPHLLLALQHYY